MLRSLAMLLLTVLAAAGMAGILAWFFRRLSAIEKAKWGGKPDMGFEGLGAAAARLYRAVFQRGKR